MMMGSDCVAIMCDCRMSDDDGGDDCVDSIIIVMTGREGGREGGRENEGRE